MLTIDETMIFWCGVAEGRLIWIPRKPTPLGFMLKTVVDQSSGVLLEAEIVEGAEIDEKKEFVEQWGKTTATTLRLMRRWWSTGKIGVADSWFASYKTAVALMKHGLFFVGNVKTAHKYFPKTWLKSQVKKRGDTCHVRVTVPGRENEEVREVYGSIHRDI